MAKLKNIVKQLSEADYKSIYDSLIESNAEKSAHLLKALRERQLADSKIMVELEVNANAYYTLRSRLNIRIEEHLIQQMESPRTDILRKVANLNEVLFTKKRTITITTLKKLEKELLDYDLANELTIIYKSLKKLHINSPEHFQYSQLYNRHIAYMLAVDKAEDLLAEYFRKYGIYFLSNDETEKLGLTLLMKEIQNVARIYESHRLYVYQSCMLVFHRLFVEPDDNLHLDGESIEDIFKHVQRIFDTYNLDPLYYHLNLVFEFLKLEYYNHYGVIHQVEKSFEEVNDAATNLLINYPFYTFGTRFLITKLERHLRLATEKEMHAENEGLFEDIEPDPLDVTRHTIHVIYRALGSYYSGRYEEAAKLINGLLNDVSLKRFPFVQMEVKAVLALQYCMLKDFELFNQLTNSIQRQIRLFGKDECENVLYFLKMLKIATSEAKREKARKINQLIPKYKAAKVTYFSPTSFIRMDKEFVDNLTAIDSPEA
ncbi:MAG: hypothetical protein KF775_00710 [Cyclobacteriaceae bacterium]|nr:hypothetical protein [Cytophagales bacterium]MBX2898136.1 hypothetical protein [Cyclobacteriaceae bacterium]